MLDSGLWMADVRSHIRHPTSLLLRFFVFFVLEHSRHDGPLSGSFAFSFFLTLDAECGPRHSHQALFVNILAAANAFAILAAIHSFERLLNRFQALEIALVKVI